MPYTPSHALVAAPLWLLFGKRIPLSALVIGCLAPDLPYLAHLAPTQTPGHTAIGVLTHALPWGVGALALWQFWLASPLLALFGIHSPEQANQPPATWYGLAVVGLLLGATSHALIDATSHASGWFVQQTPWLGAPLLELPVFKWIQYGGGIVGLIGIGLWYALVRRRQANSPTGRRSLPLGLGLIGTSCVAFAILANIVHGSTGVRAVVVHSATGILTGVVVGAVVYATLIQVSTSGESRL